MGRLPPNVRIGLALILFGILWLTGWKLWQVSHIWVPLEIPISLSQGHVRTPAFTVNTPGSYLVRIFVPWTPEFDKGPCFIQSRCPDTTAFPVSWSLSDGRRIVARNDGDGGNGYEWGIDSSVRELGTFTVEKGEYFLDVGISQDGSRLNAGSPRLVVVKNGNGQTYVEEQFVHASGLSVVCFIVAGFLIFHPAIVLRREKRVRIARDFSLTLLGPQTREIQWDPSVTCTQAANPALHRLPSFQFGLFLIIAPLAAYASLHQWVATRTFVPVDIPVSLKPGHIRTGPFRVNLVDSFSVSLNIADQPDNAQL